MLKSMLGIIPGIESSGDDSLQIIFYLLIRVYIYIYIYIYIFVGFRENFMQQIKLLFKDTFHCVMLEYSICMFCMGNAMKTVSGHFVAIQLISMTNYKEIRVKKILYTQRVF